MNTRTATTIKLTTTREIRTAYDMHCLAWEFIDDSAKELHKLASEFATKVVSTKGQDNGQLLRRHR